MLYLKATVVGVLVGFVSAVLWAYSNLPLRLYWNELLSRWRHEGFLGGVWISSVSSNSTMLVGVLGFLAGFFWSLRSTRRWLPK
jgi:hypothetical protein